MALPPSALSVLTLLLYANKDSLCSRPLYSHSLATSLSHAWVLNSYASPKKVFKERRPRHSRPCGVPVCAVQKMGRSETRLRLRQRLFLIHFLYCTNGGYTWELLKVNSNPKVNSNVNAAARYIAALIYSLTIISPNSTTLAKSAPTIPYSQKSGKPRMAHSRPCALPAHRHWMP